jgi:hypothetical protein
VNRPIWKNRRMGGYDNMKLKEIRCEDSDRIVLVLGGF